MEQRPRTRRQSRLEEVIAAVHAIEPGTLVKSVRSAGRDEHRVHVRVGGDVRLTLAKRDAELAGIAPGVGWNAMMAERAIDGLHADAARRFAMSSLRKRAQSRGQVIDKLTQRGTPRPIAQRVADELTEVGAIDDAALANAAAHAMVERRPAGRRLIEVKLRGKRLDAGMAKAAAENAVRGRDVLADALAVARKHARSLPEKLDHAARQRRLLGALARRGFESDICFQAVRRTLGATVEDSDNAG